MEGVFLLRQYHFSVPPCSSYRLYAALLSLLPPDFGDLTHRQQITPIAQYYADGVWTVSLLGSACEQVAAPVLEHLDALPLRSGTAPVTLRSVRRVEDVEELFAAPVARNGVLTFQTPTAFKSKGEYQLLPVQQLVVQNLVLRWNACLGDECPLDIAPDALQTLAEGLVYQNIQLSSHSYPLKGQSIPGVTGWLNIKNRLNGFSAVLTNVLLQFAAFSGVGIKTTLGMGGVTWQPVDPQRKEVSFP